MIDIASNSLQHSHNVKKAYELIDAVRKPKSKKSNPLELNLFTSKKQVNTPTPFEGLSFNLAANAFHYLGEIEFKLPIVYSQEVVETLNHMRLNNSLRTLQPIDKSILYIYMKEQVLNRPYFVIKTNYHTSSNSELSQCVMFGKESTEERKIFSFEHFEQDISNLFYVTREFMDAFYREYKPDFRLSMPVLDKKF